MSNYKPVAVAVLLLVVYGLFSLYLKQRSDAAGKSVAVAAPQTTPVIEPVQRPSPSQSTHGAKPGEDFAETKHFIEFDGYPAVEISLRYRSDRAIAPVPTTDNIGKVYSEWLAMAEQGDATFAFAVDTALRRCKRSHTSPEALEAAVELIYSELKYRDGSNGQDATILDNDLSVVEAGMRELFKYCSGLPTDEAKNYQGTWLKESADKGYFPAFMLMGQVLVSEGERADAVHYYEEAWKRGSDRALGQLASLYGSEGFEGKPAPILSAAYLYLNKEIFGAVFAQEERGPIITRYYATLEQNLASTLRGLRPHEQDEVIQKARQILMTNSECCYAL